MLFKTSEERALYFDRLDTDQDVSPGDAEKHAKGVKLGLFADRQALVRDCARIYAMELNVYRYDELAKCCRNVATTDVAAVLGSLPEFRRLVDIWRIDPDYEEELEFARAFESVPEPMKRKLTDRDREIVDGGYDEIIAAIDRFGV